MRSDTVPTVQSTKRIKNLLIIAGGCRNVGKTESICRLIRHFSGLYSVYALKVSAIYPDEILFHGDHSKDSSGQILFEESRRDTQKDTSKMLRAGAQKVFYLRGNGAEIAKGFTEFTEKSQEAELIICESNSLHEHIRPGMHVLIASKDKAMKKRAQKIVDQVDLLIYSSEATKSADCSSIKYCPDRGWYHQD